MSDIVKIMHILRDCRFRRCAVTKIGLFRQAEYSCRPQNPERKEIGSHADHECQPKTRSTLSTEGNRTPEAMRDNIHQIRSRRRNKDILLVLAGLIHCVEEEQFRRRGRPRKWGSLTSCPLFFSCARKI